MEKVCRRETQRYTTSYSLKRERNVTRRLESGQRFLGAVPASGHFLDILWAAVWGTHSIYTCGNRGLYAKAKKQTKQEHRYTHKSTGICWPGGCKTEHRQDSSSREGFDKNATCNRAAQDYPLGPFLARRTGLYDAQAPNR